MELMKTDARVEAEVEMERFALLVWLNHGVFEVPKSLKTDEERFNYVLHNVQPKASDIEAVMFVPVKDGDPAPRFEISGTQVAL